MTSSKTENAIVLKLILLLTGALVLTSGLLKIEPLWGLNHLKYFSPAYSIVFAVLLLLGLFDSILNRLRHLLRSLTSRFSRARWSLLLIIILLASAAIFFLLRVKVHALGDGYQRIYQIERGYYFYPTEALDFFIHAGLFRLARFFGGISAETIYIAFSILCGVALIAILADDRRRHPTERDFPLALLLSLGGSLLFFGYVESYTIYYPAVLLFVLYSFRFLKTGENIVSASICFAVAIFSHQSALFLLPAFAWLLFLNYKRANGNRERRIPLLIGSLAVVILVAIELFNRLRFGEYLKSYADTFLPLLNGEYSLFSPAHLFDLLNLLLLIFPLLFLFLYMTFTASKVQAAATRNQNWFGLLILIPSCLFILFIDPKLGMPRDWDLFASPVSALAMFIIFSALSRLRLSDLSLFRLGYFSIIFFSLWVAVNSSETRQLDRAESILELNEKGRAYGTELLAFHYRNKLGDRDKAMALFQSIKGPGRNARVLTSIAKIQLEQGQPLQALATAREGLARDSADGALHAIAGSILLRLDSTAAALPHLLKAYQLNPEISLNSYKLGQVYFNLQNDSAALRSFKTADSLEPKSYSTLFSIGQTYLRLGQLDSAYIYIESGLKLNPKDDQAWELMNYIKSLRR